MVFVRKAWIWWTICWLLIDRIKERQSVISNEYPDQGMFGLDITIFPGGIYVGISFRILSFIVNIDKIIYRIINFFHTRKFCDMIKPSNQFSHSIRFLKSSLHWANRFWRNNRVCEEIKKRCIVVKKAKRFLALFLVLCMMVCAMALPASAYSYNFSFPAQQANSMCYTSLYTRGTSTAYVDPDVTTISTIYFLSPTRVSSTQATALVYKTSGTRSNFSWLSGYGGKGNSYCLSGCPDWNVGSHTAYSSYGSWNM